VPGGTAKVLKTAKFTEILPNVGKIAAKVGSELSELPGDLKNASNAIKNLVHETEMVTPEGVRIKTNDQILMNKADDLTSGAKGAEHLQESKLLSRAADVDEYLEKLPKRGPRDKTAGILVAGEHEVELLSGYEGPTKALQMPAPGFNNVVKAHVEAHAAAFMKQNALTVGRIYINNEEICTECQKYLHIMLSPGTKLEVVLRDGQIETFIGGIK
jgi:hypothetical protein